MDGEMLAMKTGLVLCKSNSLNDTFYKSSKFNLNQQM